jgi:pimeloyl-ACP methyl ester carboxylesterase
MDVTEHTVVGFDGAELHVEAAGPADAPLTVVLVHGWTLSSASWRAQVEALVGSPGAGVRVLAYDQRGHGRSTPGDEWWTGVAHPKWGSGPSVDQLGRDLDAVLEALAPKGPVILAGHSMGGMTIMALADQRPELFGDRVRGVLLVDTSSGGLHRLSFGFPQWMAAPVRQALIRPMRRMAEEPGRADRFRSRQRTESKVAVAQSRWIGFGKKAPRSAVVEFNELVKACGSATLGGFFPGLLTHDKRDASLIDAAHEKIGA